jgi:hypothetical protein
MRPRNNWALRLTADTVFDPDDLPRRCQDRVPLKRRVQDYIAPLLAAAEIDLETGKGSAGQLVVGDTGVNNRPEGLAVQRERPGRKGGERDHARGENQTYTNGAPFTPRQSERRSTPFSPVSAQSLRAIPCASGSAARHVRPARPDLRNFFRSCIDHASSAGSAINVAKRASMRSPSGA